MDRRSVFSKTAKGLSEATGKTSLLSRELRNILKEIDGKATMAELEQKLEKYNQAKLTDIFTSLTKDGFIRELGGVAVAAPAAKQSATTSTPVDIDLDDLDFTAVAAARAGGPSES